jgi:DNA-binding Lrp family transcriptional regulator
VLAFLRRHVCAACGLWKNAGFIKGYHASVDGQMLGFGVTVFAMVGLDSQAESDLQAFEARVNEWPEVRNAICSMARLILF